MKKKLLVLLMTSVVAAGSITACGSKTAETTAAETTTVAESMSEAESADTEAAAESEETSAEAEAAVDGDFAANYDTYLSWTGKEWSAASDADKENAAIAYSVYLMEALSGQEFDKNEITENLDAAKASGQLPNLIKQLDDNFTSMDMSLKEFVDMAAEQMADLTSQAAQ